MAAVIAGACAFAVVTSLMVAGMQAPRRPLDYFLCGATGTFTALLAVFVAFVNPARVKGVLYKERRPATQRASVRKNITLGI